MDFMTYQEAAAQTAIYSEQARVIYPAFGLANEAGEVLGKLKKGIRDGGFEFGANCDDCYVSGTPFLSIGLRDTLKAELGDCLWYLAALASDAGLQLSDIAEDNISKLRSRQERGVLKGSGDNR
jgi:NTP pyrophosphatase (non-canonical NTP hydrolase)